MDNLNVKQHFRPDEGPLIDQIQDWIETVRDQYRPVLTWFLNPRQRYILTTIVNQDDQIKAIFNGGYEQAEMQRALIFPDYYQPQATDYELQLLEIDYPRKFAELHHRQIMGSLLSSGIDRNVFGDILGNDLDWQVVVDAKMVPYLQAQVTQVGKIHIGFLPLAMEQVIQPQSDWEETAATVSSLRLDVIVAAAFNYSRNRAKLVIEHGLVRVNWQEVDRPDYPVAIFDQLSVRHAGRVQLQAVNGYNKKQKIRISLGIIHA